MSSGPLPQRVGDYELVQSLGSGTSGRVFLARRAGIERSFALKILPAHMDAEGLGRLQREARVASRLEHPGLVRVLDVGWVERRPYLVMEHVPGADLHDWLRGRGPLPWREAVGLVAPMARALQVAHAAGVFHRDLKPANVILDARDGRPRITDFGLAHEVGSDMGLTATGDVLGTPYYMAPEQVRGDQVDARCDVYALGVILYEMLAGRRPFESQSVPELYGMIQAGRRTPLRELWPELPAPVCEVCERAFAVDPELRPQDAGALADELEALTATEAVATEPASVIAWPRWAGALIVGVAAGVLVVAAWAAWQARAAGRAEAETERARAGAEVLAAEVKREREEVARRSALLDERAAASAAAQQELEAARRDADELALALRREAEVGARPLGMLGETVDRVIDALRAAEGGSAVLAANLLRNRARYREAAELAAAAWEAGERDPELLVVEFRAWQAAGEGGRSQAPLQRLLEVAPAETLPGLFGLGIHGDLGGSEEAADRVLAAAEAATGAPGYMWILAGRWLRGAAQHAEGPEHARLVGRTFEAAQRAVEVDPCCPDAFELRTWALVELRRLGQPRPGDLEQVVFDCRLARELAPADPAHWLRAGQILVLAGRPDLAVVELEAAIERAAQDPHQALQGALAGVWLTNAQLERGAGEAAVEAFGRALGSHPGAGRLALELDGYLQRAPSPLRGRLLAMVDPEWRPRLEGPGR